MPNAGGFNHFVQEKPLQQSPCLQNRDLRLPVQHLQGKSWCHPAPRLQPGSLLLPQELGKPSKRHCGASGASAQAVADNSAGGYALSGPGGCDPAQEEQEQSLATGRVAAAPQTWSRGGLAGSSSVPEIRGSFCPESHLHELVLVSAASAQWGCGCCGAFRRGRGAFALKEGLRGGVCVCVCLGSAVPPAVLSVLSSRLAAPPGREIALIRANYGVQALCLIALINY